MADKDLYKQLREPFVLKYISWKINNYNRDQTKAMITFHIDARAVQHRLNEVLGVDGWSFSYSELERDLGVHGKLTIYPPRTATEAREVTREDVGYPSSPNKSEWYKDAVSDALKRCAVHFGVGHFLYALPSLWLELTEPGQRYLTEEQDKYCREWLKDKLDKMKGSS